MGPEACGLLINVTSTFSRNHDGHSAKSVFEEITASYFSSIHFVITPSTPKLVNCLSSVLFTICFATQQVNETFTVTVKLILYADLVTKLLKVSVICILVHT